MKASPPFRPETIVSISKILAETSTGLTGPEIAHLLGNCQIKDITPEMTKWKRLSNALGEGQNKRQYSNHIIAFIHKAMSPVSHVHNKEGLNQKGRLLILRCLLKDFN